MKVHSFDHVAKDYAAKATPHRYAHYVTLVHELNLSGDEILLDIGCGPGILSLEVARQLHSGKLIGIDNSPSMINLAINMSREQGIANADFMVGDALALDFPSGSFNLVMSSLTFPWVKDQTRFLSEVNRVLKPGGRLVMITLSNIVYREFTKALKESAHRHPNLLNVGNNVLKFLGARAYTLDSIVGKLKRAQFVVDRRFRLTTEDPVTPNEYLTRINAIVDENYLEGLRETDKQVIRNDIISALSRRNGSLAFTESALFIVARKLGSSGYCNA